MKTLWSSQAHKQWQLLKNVFMVVLPPCGHHRREKALLTETQHRVNESKLTSEAGGRTDGSSRFGSLKGSRTNWELESRHLQDWTPCNENRGIVFCNSLLHLRDNIMQRNELHESVVFVRLRVFTRVYPHLSQQIPIGLLINQWARRKRHLFFFWNCLRPVRLIKQTCRKRSLKHAQAGQGRFCTDSNPPSQLKYFCKKQQKCCKNAQWKVCYHDNVHAKKYLFPSGCVEPTK